MSTEKFNNWCVVELFGHTQMIGLVSEATIGGCAFVRVDVPETNKSAPFTRYLGQGAIYSMIPIGEGEAKHLIEAYGAAPPFIWQYKAATERLLAPAEDDDLPY